MGVDCSVTYFLSELVTSVRTSWFSSSSSMVPRYPRRLSAKRGEASSFRHSIWPKWVRSPRVKRYSNLATLFLLGGASAGSGEAGCLRGHYRTLESWLSSRKLARMAALSFCTTARSSAMVLAARTLRINCLTFGTQWSARRVGVERADRVPRTGAHCAGVVLDAEATGGDCSRRRAWREWVVIWSTWSRAVRSMKRESLP